MMSKNFSVLLLFVISCSLIFLGMIAANSGLEKYLINWQNYFQIESNDGIKASSFDSKENLFEIAEVVDGDTIKIYNDGATVTVRLIGINTPEVVDPRKPVQCYGKEASSKLKELLKNKKVILESDLSQDDVDKYGRWLRYVFFEEGTSVNLWMIENGFAYEYTYENPYKYQKIFKEAEKRAKDLQVGLWDENTCGGVL